MTSNTPSSNFEIGKGDTTSFEPVDAGFVGTGPMDSRAQYTQPPPVVGQPSEIPPVQQQPQGYLQRIQNFFSMERLQTSFDVDTEDVKERIIASLKHANDPDHFRVNVLGQEGKRPDCYGPFWISMTLAFFLSVTANTSKFLQTDSLEGFEYDISHLTKAFTIVFFFSFGVPFFLYIMFSCINVDLGFTDLNCIYGYSLVPFIPVTILCMLPFVLFEWLILALATAWSGLLVLRNVAGPLIRTGNTQWSGPLCMFIMACHFIFCTVVKFHFYKHHMVRGNNDDDSPLAETDDGNVIGEGDDLM